MDRTFLTREQVGAVELIPIVDCTLDFPAASVWPDADPAAPGVADVLDARQCLQVPVTCLVLRDKDTPSLVETGVGPSPYSGFSFPANSPLSGLTAIGVRPDDFGCVVLTHLHPDHVGWNCDDSGHTTYPNARYVVTRAEWRYWSAATWRVAPLRRVGEILERRGDPLERSGQLHLVAADHQLSRSTRLVPLPGHSGISIRKMDQQVNADRRRHASPAAVRAPGLEPPLGHRYPRRQTHTTIDH